MTYHRSVEIPKAWGGRHVLLHFGAVDGEAKASVNGKELGVHRGGYDGFSFDISDALKAADAQEITVEVFDPTDNGGQPHGKQVLRPDHYFYTSTSGIWQTVWLEPVTEHHITGLHMVPNIDAGCLHVTVDSKGTVEAVATDEGKEIARASGPAGSELKLAIPDPKLWSPDSPHLYDLTVALKLGDQVVDTVTSYFGMGKIALGNDDKGVLRIMLNGTFVFQVGPLDQGFWSDGIYTAPTDDALRFDVAEMKRLGFNGVRKHVTVEPDRWYYWCDKIGLLVWQDMPSGKNTTDEDTEQFEVELLRMIEGRGQHPSIIMWVPFNEGWGQFDTERLTRVIKNMDPNRLVDSASGWRGKNGGDVNDGHGYVGPGGGTPWGGRASVNGEFGGCGLNVPGHVWKDPVTGYKDCQSIQDMTRQYEKRLVKAWELEAKVGLSAAIYTQITDMEAEGNGLLTYDSAVNKVIPERAAAVNSGEPALAMVTKDVVPTSQLKGVNWHYAFEQPATDWNKHEFKDAAWKQGPGGFGTKGMKDRAVGTEWNTDDIWLRLEFEWNGGTLDKDTLLMFSICHTWGEAEISINGTLANKIGGSPNYAGFPISAKGVEAMKPGKNVLAAHCKRRKATVMLT